MKKIGISLLGILLLTTSALAEPTQVKVRVIAQDAKVIGTGVGGVRVIVEEAVTGDILAKETHLGRTGDTDSIMRTPLQRQSNRFPNDNAAYVEPVVDIAEPTLVNICAEGPLAYPQAMQKAMKTILLIPGEDIAGEGIILTLHGFIVEIMEPESVDRIPEGEKIELQASVRMLCGCPTEPGGLWDSNDYKIEAMLLQNKQVMKKKPMTFAGQTNIYETSFLAPSLNGKEKAPVEVVVVVSQPKKANFGMDRTTYLIVKK
ncbi:hypothetical protein GF373_15815 [bacterium]|nr:hypothetical protein [bacterium]